MFERLYREATELRHHRSEVDIGRAEALYNEIIVFCRRMSDDVKPFEYWKSYIGLAKIYDRQKNYSEAFKYIDEVIIRKAGKTAAKGE